MENIDFKKQVTRDREQCGNEQLYLQHLRDKDRRLTNSRPALAYMYIARLW